MLSAGSAFGRTVEEGILHIIIVVREELFIVVLFDDRLCRLPARGTLCCRLCCLHIVCSFGGCFLNDLCDCVFVSRSGNGGKRGQQFSIFRIIRLLIKLDLAGLTGSGTGGRLGFSGRTAVLTALFSDGGSSSSSSSSSVSSS